MADNVDQLDADDVKFTTATVDKGVLGEVQAVAIDYGEVGERRLAREGDGLPVRVQAAALPNGAATEAKQDVANAALGALVAQTDAVEGTLANVLAKLPTAPALEAKQDVAIAALGSPGDNGTTAAAAAATDGTGVLTLASGLRRLVVAAGTMLNRIPLIGKQTVGASMPVTIANADLDDLHMAGPANITAVNTNLLTGSTSLTDWIDCLGYRSAAIQYVMPAGTYASGTVLFEGTNDPTRTAGLPLTAWQTDNPANSFTQDGFFGPGTRAAVVALPFRYFRPRLIVAVSGTTPGVQCFATFRRVSATVQSMMLQPSSQRIGYVTPSGVWFIDTVTPLAAGATFTGPARDFINSSPNTAFGAGVSAAIVTMRALAAASHAGKLWVEISPDFGATWVRVAEQDTVALSDGRHVARIDMPTHGTRQRVGFNNGPAAQSQFFLTFNAVSA